MTFYVFFEILHTFSRTLDAARKISHLGLYLVSFISMLSKIF